MKLTNRILLISLIAMITAAIGFNRGAALVAANSAPPTNSALHERPVDLSLTKQVGPSAVDGFRVGSKVIYRLTIKNALEWERANGENGETAEAVNIQVKDDLPKGLTYFSSNPAGSYDPQSGIWAIAKLPPGESNTLDIVAIINNEAHDSITNYAQIWRATPEDVDSIPGNNSHNEDDDASVTIDLAGAKGSIAGNVYIDADNDGIRDQGEAGIGGVTITLRNDDNSVTRTVTTQSNGTYIFNNLPAGTYKVAESQPPDYLDGKDAVGSAGGTLANDLISNIRLRGGVNAIGYNFGERGAAIDLAIAKSHTGNFTAGTNGVYKLTVTNVGDTTTTGAINVTDILPSGLSFVSGVGQGWYCSSEDDRKVVCDRPWPLDRGEVTTITLTVSVATRILT